MQIKNLGKKDKMLKFLKHFKKENKYDELSGSGQQQSIRDKFNGEYERVINLLMVFGIISSFLIMAIFSMCNLASSLAQTYPKIAIPWPNLKFTFYTLLLPFVSLFISLIYARVGSHNGGIINMKELEKCKLLIFISIIFIFSWIILAITQIAYVWNLWYKTVPFGPT